MSDDSDTNKLHFSSSHVCRSFLLGCCPHEILSQTKYDLGKCPKLHDVALKADFENSRKFEYDFQVKVHQQLKNFIKESERRIRMTKIKLALTQDLLNAEEARKVDYLRQLDEKINDAVKQAESLGTMGDIEKSLNLMKKVEELREGKSKAVLNFKNTIPSSSGQQKKLRVCEVCCSYLGFSDDDKRLADHFNGKLHLGFLYIRQKLNELEHVMQNKCIKEILDNEFKSSNSCERSCSSTLCRNNDASENLNTSCIHRSNKKRRHGESSEGKQVHVKADLESSDS